ncbi:SDR family NAD(P)-dependent oxidoreductase [Haladaptatus sp. CMAA 1911]|uniref:SDR family NAD(P)-dependent oxidoreductase n=1 Tax=unclassified Haladaptatus TaxID=2622732 RepID=UPI003754E8F3
MATGRFDFSDETVIVTGGSSGIGRATALAFADAGAVVINADLREDPKDRGEEQPTHVRIRENGGEGIYREVDVTDPDQIEALVACAREYGGVDVMINNAAITQPKSVREVTKKDLDRIHAVNVESVFFGTRCAANDMIDRGEPGVVLNTASISSSFAQGGSVHYEATKGAVRMITRGTALELSNYDIRVNAVAPGQIATEIAEGWTEQAVEGAEDDSLLKSVPLGRAGSPREVADAFLFLASDLASYTTGELLYVDGGWQIC